MNLSSFYVNRYLLITLTEYDFLHTTILYLDCLGGGFPPEGNMDAGCIVIGNPDKENTVGWESGSHYGCGIGCNVGQTIFFLPHALPYPFLGMTALTVF